MLDPWVALSAIAVATERIRIGPMVTPISRRRPHKLARETITLDHLSRGRLTLGVGLGSDSSGELEPFGEESDPKARARLLDDGLEKLAGYWAGEFEPLRVQRPRIPVWVAGRWPNRRPLRRAAKWDGLFPIDLPEPDALGELAADLADLREDPDAPFDLVSSGRPRRRPRPWEAAGATWVLTSFGQSPARAGRPCGDRGWALEANRALRDPPHLAGGVALAALADIPRLARISTAPPTSSRALKASSRASALPAPASRRPRITRDWLTENLSSGPGACIRLTFDGP